MNRQKDADIHKGAVEDDSVNADKDERNTSMQGQNPHRGASPMAAGQDTDYPEPGQNPEHTGESEDVNPEAEEQAQEPGFSQKMNQNWQREDPLAS
jgi:hypothetical protein